MGTLCLYTRNRASLAPLPPAAPTPARASAPASPFDRYDLAALALLGLVAALFLIPPLWKPGIVNPGDFLMSVHRVMELDSAWAQGIYYPRLGPSFNFGYGAPLFQFYPPLASYVGLFFHWLGFGLIGATKAVLSLSLLLAGMGAYVCGRLLLGWRPAALAAGLLYLASPYLLLVIYERGAVAEMLVWGLAPWLLWAAHSALLHRQRSRLLLTALLVAAVFLAHNATALFVIPGMALYVAALAAWERRWAALMGVAAAFALGAALSAFYWLPAMAEVGFTSVTTYMFQGTTAAVNNVVPPAQVMQHSLLPQYTGDERFRLSLWQFVLGAAGALVALWRGRRTPPGLLLLAAALLILLLLQTTWSLPFWQHVPLVRFIQFPWRLHGLVSLCVAMLGGGLLLPLAAAKAAWRTPLLAAAALLGALLVWMGATNMAPQTSTQTSTQTSSLWVTMAESEVTQAQMWERGRSIYPLWADYTLQSLSIGTIGLLNSRAPDDPSLLPATTTPQITISSYNPQQIALQVDAPQPWTLRLHAGAFPGWQVQVDGRAVATSADGEAGLVSAALPAGAYAVTARFGQSALRMAADWVSLVAAAIWLAWAMRPRRVWVAAAIVVGATLLPALAIRLLTVEAKVATTPTAVRAEFDNGVTLLGYTLEQPQLCAGESTTLRTWWHASTTPAADYKYFVHLIVPDDSARVAQFDALPAAGYVPMTRWEAGELVPESQQLLLDPTVPPGSYSLLIGLYDPLTGQNAPIRDAPDVLPGDRLRLTALEVVDCSE